jgi:hypothetical protein
VYLHILWKGAPERTLRLCSTSSILQASDQFWKEAAAFLIDPLAEGLHLVHESEGLSVTEDPHGTQGVFEQQEKPDQGARIHGEWIKRERAKHEC